MVKRIADSATHFGLRGVGERVRHLGGSFVAKPARDGGFVVRTRLPLSPARQSTEA
jgi:signal transduction histidine kinase